MKQVKYIILLMLLSACGKVQENLYQCPSTQVCYQMCSDLHPTDPVAREQCFDKEVDRLTGEEDYKLFVESLSP